MGAHCEDIGESIEDLCDSDGTDEFSLTIKKRLRNIDQVAVKENYCVSPFLQLN